jgi:hypothetical protein
MLFVKLALVPAVSQNTDSRAQRMNRAIKATIVAPQASKVVAQFGVVSFDRVCLALVRHSSINTLAIGDFGVGGELVAVIPMRLWRFVNQFLDQVIADKARDPNAYQTVRGTVNYGHDERFVFFFPMKV